MGKPIVVGMSGGVDSSAAASLLKEQGHEVIGMYMKNWEEKDEQGVCQSSKEFEDVVKVCETLGIPYYTVNFCEEYLDHVFAGFIEEMKQGITPNPDVLCNREIKFKVLLEKARALGGEFLATGHYCRIRQKGGETRLLRGLDPNKDQSYFLCNVSEQALQYARFPLGEMEKSSVREYARSRGLPTAEKKDSTGICFIGKRNFKQFVSQYIPFEPGNFETTSGKIVGRHDGTPFYTIGQRRGLGIGGPGEAWFVVGKDPQRNVVFVEQGGDHPALFSSSLRAGELSWVSSKGVPELPFRCTCKVRYRQADHPCTIEKIEGGEIVAAFDSPQRAVTPGQYVVFYDGEICLGGGKIKTSGRSRF